MKAPSAGAADPDMLAITDADVERYGLKAPASDGDEAVPATAEDVDRLGLKAPVADDAAGVPEVTEDDVDKYGLKAPTSDGDNTGHVSRGGAARWQWWWMSRRR